MRTYRRELGWLDSASLVVVIIFGLSVSPVLARSTQSFAVPDDVALRIRLDDTFTSISLSPAKENRRQLANPACCIFV
jgi:hypothetical protein